MRPKFGLLVVCLAMLGALLLWSIAPQEKTLFTELEPGPFKAVYLVEDAESKRARVDLIFPSGEVDHSGPEGLAHYVEHLAWINAFGDKAKDGKGLRHSNAWTSRFATGYFLTGAEADLPAMLARLANLSAPIDLERAATERERKIVLREFFERTSERPRLVLWNEIENALYKDTPLARRPVGRAETIALYTSEAALKLHTQTHLLEQATLVAYGAIDPKELASEIAKMCPCGGESTLPSTVPLLPEGTLRDEADERELDLASDSLALAMLAKLPADYDAAKANAAIGLLHWVLNSSQEGGLNGPLRLNQFLARSFWVEVTYHPAHAIELRFEASPDTGVSIGELQEAFERVLGKLAADGPPQASFDQIKDRRLTELEEPNLTAKATAAFIRNAVSNRQAPVSHAKALASVSDLTRNDLTDLLKQLTQNSRVVIRRVWQSKDT